VYLAADHASRHHDSCAGRVAIAAYQAAVYHNPVYRAAQAASGNTTAAVGTTPRCKSGESPCTAVCIQVEADAATINPSAHRLPGSIGLREEEAEPSALELDWGPGGVAVELVPPPRVVSCHSCVSGEECEQLPVVPRVLDDETPAFMPYAEEPEPHGGFLGFWKQMIRKLSSSGVGFKDCCQEKEENEAPNYGKPPECREDPYHSQQYPGCPASVCPHHRNYCPHSGRMIVPAVVPEPQSETGAAARRARFLDESEECEARPKHPEVDTMEFRPTDAKPGEFRLVPI
jgi:hypothetical protein